MLAMLAKRTELGTLALVERAELPNVVGVARGRRDSDAASRRLAERGLLKSSLHGYTIPH